MKPTIGVILAAGKGTRMLDASKPKVLFPLKGKPLIEWVIESMLPLELERIIAVVGYQREQVISFLAERYPNIEIAIQYEQLGTGHAVLQAMPILGSQDATLLIVNGDVPLVRPQTLREFLDSHRNRGDIFSILTTHIPWPHGYGRILRNDDGSVRAIVEDADLESQHHTITEINTGIYAADADHLRAALFDATNQNAQGEYYLTDAVGILVRRGLTVVAWPHPDWRQFLGVNTREQLAQIEQILSSHDRAGSIIETSNR